MYFVLAIIGFSGGLVVGGALAAFLTVLGVITRLIEITKTKRYLTIYKFAILSGTIVSTLSYNLSIKVNGSGYILILVGLFMGIFVGMVASALAEVLNVMPLFADVLGGAKWVYVIIFAMIIGKIIGSLIYWIVPGLY